jgi:hypothetical protein
MKKLVLIPLSFGLFNFASAQGVNLICDMTYREGNSVSQRLKTRIEVSQLDNGNLFIISDSDLIGSVSTIKRQGTISITNFSNSSKWDLRVVSANDKNSSVLDIGIIIDRNAGSISYNSSFSIQGRTMHSSGFGYCEKINQNIKKF